MTLVLEQAARPRRRHQMTLQGCWSWPQGRADAIAGSSRKAARKMDINSTLSPPRREGAAATFSEVSARASEVPVSASSARLGLEPAKSFKAHLEQWINLRSHLTRVRAHAARGRAPWATLHRVLAQNAPIRATSPGTNIALRHMKHRALHRGLLGDSRIVQLVGEFSLKRDHVSDNPSLA